MNDYEVDTAAGAHLVLHGPHDEVWEHIEGHEPDPTDYLLSIGNPDSKAYALIGSLEDVEMFAKQVLALVAAERGYARAAEGEVVADTVAIGTTRQEIEA